MNALLRCLSIAEINTARKMQGADMMVPGVCPECKAIYLSPQSGMIQNGKFSEGWCECNVIIWIAKKPSFIERIKSITLKKILMAKETDNLYKIIYSDPPKDGFTKPNLILRYLSIFELFNRHNLERCHIGC